MLEEIIYLDHAATTFLLPEVKESMLPYLDNIEKYGNPSSIHSFGREAKIAIEKSRKTIASILKTSPAQIFFTSGGTEADNTAIISSYFSFKFSTIITSKLEHHAVLHAAQFLNSQFGVIILYVKTDKNGMLCLDDFENKLKSNPNSFVSLMHGNNEVGNLINLHTVGTLIKSQNSIFHSDTVQTMGHYAFNLAQTPVDFIVGAAHKFHGPKGVGFLYINQNVKIPAHIHGGTQERNMRGGTENVASIVGMAKALEIAQKDIDIKLENVIKIKKYFIENIKNIIPNIRLNGNCESDTNSLAHVINIAFPSTDIDEMLLFKLDINKICVSGGSACTSGALGGSHVLNAIYGDTDDLPSVRFSLCNYTTISELDKVIEVIKSIYKV